MEFPVIINKTEYGYDAHCPVLRGCHSQGDTLEDAQENIKDAIRTYLEMDAGITDDDFKAAL
ncbi:MAG: type II toxin-antitoxin system HicB family antitoxin [Nitrospirae bacterium]|nr:type II toxin-antitoxin system HicB family antitoxin [Nitrospirota bacterium]MBF0535158.1 type II toxin-antitoxin system HicB family antitoxin [Nitrospirota bacterium]